MTSTPNTPADDATAPMAPMSAETEAMMKDLFERIDREREIEEQARKEATEQGTISPYDVPVDQRGHLHRSEHLPPVVSRKTFDFDLAESGQASITHEPDRMPDWGLDLTAEERADHLSLARKAEMSRPCYWCGAKPLYSYDGTALTSTTECAYPDGYEVVTTLNVTSGKIVFAPDLAFLYDSHDDTYDTYGRSAGGFGRAAEMRGLAADGCAFGFVPRRYLSLFAVGGDTWTIVAPRYDDDNDEVLYDGTELAETDDDYDTYSVVDYDDFIARGGVVGQYGTTVVEVPNGVYTFTHHTLLKSFDADDYSTTQVFATITRADA